MSVLRSIRFPDETFAFLMALAEKHGQTVNGVVVSLVNIAYAANTPDLPEAEVGRIMRGLNASERRKALKSISADETLGYHGPTTRDRTPSAAEPTPPAKPQPGGVRASVPALITGRELAQGIKPAKAPYGSRLKVKK